MTSIEAAPPAGLGRRLASLVYEGMLLFAVVFFAGLVFHGAATMLLQGWTRHLFQAYLFLVIGLYFIWCWARGGQTLPMKTWKLKLVRSDGKRVSAAAAVMRYMLAWISLLPLGAGFLWAAFDRERQFLHDRLAGTRIVVAE